MSSLLSMFGLSFISKSLHLKFIVQKTSDTFSENSTKTKTSKLEIH